MSLPLANTTITVLRSAVSDDTDRDSDGEGYDPAPGRPVATWTPVSTGIRAIISPASARTAGPGDTQKTDLVLVCDPTDIKNTDRIVDESNGVEYKVTYSFTSPGVLGILGSTQAGLLFSS